MVYDGYSKVMSNIPKMGHLTTPGLGRLWMVAKSCTRWQPLQGGAPGHDS